MAKKSAVERNKKREKLAKSYGKSRYILKEKLRSSELTFDEKFEIVMKLARIPRNSAKNRVRNRCMVTGKPRSYYRRMGLSRTTLRTMASSGLLPGVVRASW